MLRAPGVSVLAAACLALWPGLAVAANAPVAVRLVYSAAPGCPGEITFRSQVQARTAQLAFEPTARDELVVQITTGPSGYQGQFQLTGHPTAEPPLEAASCDEVVAALALAVALRVDTQAQAVPDAPRQTERPRPPPTQPRTRVWDLGLEAGATTGFPQPVALELGAFVASIDESMATLRLPPDLYLTLGAAFGGTVAKPGLSADILALESSIDACPARLGKRPRLSLCGFIGAGVLLVRLDSGDTAHAPQAHLGPAVRLRWTWGRLAFGARLSAEFSAIRPVLLFRPNTEAYRVPVVSADGQAFLAYTLR